jgi:TRAP-type uncharacterized transport system substrate-binding protein
MDDILVTIIEYIAIFAIIIFLYRRFMSDSKESFQSLFMDDIVNTKKDIVLNNFEDYPIYKIGTASKDTYPVELGNYMKKHIYPCIPVISNGTMDNINSLLSHKLDMALVDEDVWLTVIDDNDNEALKNYTGVAVLYDQPCLLISAQGRNVYTLNDILGKRIGVTGKSSNSYYHYLKLIKINNMKSVEILKTTQFYEDQDQMFTDLLNNKLDVVYITTTQKNKALLELSKSIKVRFISPITNTNKDLIKKQFRLSKPTMIDLSNFYSNINTVNYINTISTRMLLVCRKNIPEKHIHYLLSNLMKDLIPLQQNINKYLYDSNLNNVVTNAFEFDSLASMNKEVELHSGAKKFYNEVGLLKIEEKVTDAES